VAHVTANSTTRSPADRAAQVAADAGPARELFLCTGDFYFGIGPLRLRTLLGSCVSVTFWHPQRHLGGMCHYLLPRRGNAPSAADARPGLYADEVIALLVERIYAARTAPADYVVKLFGGGNMFDRSAPATCQPGTCMEDVGDACAPVPCRNVIAGRALLARHGFRLSAEDTGGYRSRQLLLDLPSGEVWLRYGAHVGTSVGGGRS
jgi:chemotaxis protein CheD